MKILAIVSIGLFSAVYWGVGALLNATMALWLLMFPPLQNPSYVPQNSSDVQLGSYVQQATPTRLQGAINPQN